MNYQYTVSDLYQINRKIKEHQGDLIKTLTALSDIQNHNQAGHDKNQILNLKSQQSQLLKALASKWLPFYLSEAYAAWQNLYEQIYATPNHSESLEIYQCHKYEKHYFHLLTEYIQNQENLSKEVKEFIKLSMLQQVSYNDYLSLKPLNTDDQFLYEQLSNNIELAKYCQNDIKLKAMEMIKIFEFQPANFELELTDCFLELLALEQTKVQLLITDIYAQMPTANLRSLLKTYGKLHSLKLSLFQNAFLINSSELFQKNKDIQAVESSFDYIKEIQKNIETISFFIATEISYLQKASSHPTLDEAFSQLVDLLEIDAFEDCMQHYLLAHPDMQYISKTELFQLCMGLKSFDDFFKHASTAKKKATNVFSIAKMRYLTS